LISIFLKEIKKTVSRAGFSRPKGPKSFGKPVGRQLGIGKE
jgi:hypothetical protein